jgi:hypothetical protein
VLERLVAELRLAAEEGLKALADERAARIDAEAKAEASAATAAVERAARIEAEAKAEASTAAATVESAARIEAEAKAEASAAKAEASAAAAAVERAARIAAVIAQVAAETNSFLNEMRGVAGSSSVDTTTRADVHRRGATDPVAGSDEAIYANLPLTVRGSVGRAWAAFACAHKSGWSSPPPDRLLENAHVHPTVARLLDAVVAHDALRVWHERFVEDDVAAAKIRPDFSLTHVRDSGVSAIGAAVMIEVKLPGALKDAITQLCAYLRRRTYKLCCERHARGEPFHDVFALGAATDGCKVVLVRMLSGAPAPGSSFVSASPCPSTSSDELPLLDNWDFRESIDFAASQPPSGFSALARLCGSVAALGDAAPLESLRADVVWAADGGGAPRVTVDFELGLRLGCGGTSDAYEWTADATAVVKVARCQTTEAIMGFAAEERALGFLRHAASAGLVPKLLGVGSRTPDARAGAHGGGGAWPLLVMRPRGTPLAEWVAARVAAAPRRGARAARRAAASAVVGRVLDALAAAADVGVVHCDVRPANIVVVGDAAVLVDWGCSVARGDEAVGRGVAAYADARVFAAATTSFAARPAQDVAGALYTWLAIACDAGCDAPWLALPPPAQLEAGAPVPGVLARRAAWLAEAPTRGDVTESFAGALSAALAVKTAGAGTEEANVFALARAAVGLDS